jgi:hypothetical protein
MSVSIHRPHERRLVKWRNSATSDPVQLVPGAAWNLYVPGTFAGTQVQILAKVMRDIDDPVTEETIIDEFKVYNNGLVTITPDIIHDLTELSLFGLDFVKFESDETENCTGELLLSS